MADLISSNDEQQAMAKQVEAIAEAAAQRDSQIAQMLNLVPKAAALSTAVSRAISFTKKTWVDDPTSGTPITAADMNRLEQAIVDLNTTLTSVQDSLSRMLTSKGTLPTDTDLNDLKTPGVYVTQPGIDNLPSGGDGWGVVVVFNPNPNNAINCTQLYLGPMTKSRWTAGPYGNWYGWS